ncbi:MAG: TetR/AcrR family transcriptional regulator [Actinomycetota bacterium]
MPKISAPTLEKHRAETVDRLLDAFGELILSRGYADVSLADVAAQAGLARTAIYNYFPDREALLFAWTDREVARTLSILQHELEAAPTYAEKVHTFVRLQLLDFTRRHLPPGHEVVGLLRPETYGNFMRHVEPLERIAREIVEQGIEAGEFAAAVDPATAVQMMIACIGSERAPLTTRAHSLEEATERVSDFLLRALGWSARPKKRAAPKKQG